jgi:hypothetical protein
MLQDRRSGGRRRSAPSRRVRADSTGPTPAPPRRTRSQSACRSDAVAGPPRGHQRQGAISAAIPACGRTARGRARPDGEWPPERSRRSRGALRDGGRSPGPRGRLWGDLRGADRMVSPHPTSRRTGAILWRRLAGGRRGDGGFPDDQARSIVKRVEDDVVGHRRWFWSFWSFGFQPVLLRGDIA